VSRSPRKRLYLYLSRSRWSLEAIAAWQQSVIPISHGIVENSDIGAASAWGQAVKGAAGAHLLRPALHVTLGSEGTRNYMVEVPKGVRSLVELRAIATARFAQLFSDDPSAWRFCGAWRASGRFPVCALPVETLQTIRQLAATAKVHLASVSAEWARILESELCQAGGWIGVAGSDAITVLRSDSSQSISSLRTFSFANDLSIADVGGAVSRYMLASDPGHTPSEMTWIGSRACPADLSSLGAMMVRRTPLRVGTSAWWCQP
jgi:hypothetical protein